MAETVEDNVTELLEAAEELYHRLVLLVGKSGSGKTSVIQNLAKRNKTHPININQCLSRELLELTEKQRQSKLPGILAQITSNTGRKVFLDNIEILFDVNLKQDPLRLLQGLSRNLTVVASWNGTRNKGKLIYAEPGHSEYRSYEIVDTLIVNLNNQKME